MDNPEMQAGKLSHRLLADLLGEIESTDPRVALGPKIGEDAALIDMGDRYLVAKTDPVTFASDALGAYLVQVNANDLAVMGASPRWLLVTLLLPEGTRSEAVSALFGQLRDACRTLGVSLIGGHTEITHGIERPIAVGAMLGEVAKEDAVLTAGARPGDALVLTKGYAIEGAAILARESADALRAAGLDAGAIARAARLLFDPGISVVRDAAIARAAADIHAMHDPTEGGVATALHELCEAAQVGVVVESAALPLLPECEAVCAALGLDPLGLIASGALLATVAPEHAEPLVSALEREGVPARVIGRVTEHAEGMRMRTPSGERELPRFDRDELARFLSP